jgi:hypothetical protein
MKKVIMLYIYFFLNCSQLSFAKDDSYIIRRAYIHILGIIPTEEEIDWYCIYNKNGYELAIKWLVSKNKAFEEKKLPREFFLTKNKTLLSKDELNKIILYISGDYDKQITEQNIKESSLKIIHNSKLTALNDLEIIDNITNKLMCRSTNINEANFLLGKLNFFLKIKNENDAWLEIFNEILNLEDVKNK